MRTHVLIFVCLQTKVCTNKSSCEKKFVRTQVRTKNRTQEQPKQLAKVLKEVKKMKKLCNRVAVKLMHIKRAVTIMMKYHTLNLNDERIEPSNYEDLINF